MNSVFKSLIQKTKDVFSFISGRKYTLSEMREIIEFILQHSFLSAFILDEEGNIKFINNYALDELGYKKGQLLDNNINDIIKESEHDGRSLSFFQDLRDKKITVNYSTFLKEDEEDLPLKEFSHLIDFKDNEFEFLITETLHSSENIKKINYIAFHDNLTGLFNKKYFETRVKYLDNKSKYPISFLTISIDHIDKINYEKGYKFTDRIIKSMAGILRSNTRKDDVLARWSESKFLIALPTTEEKIVFKLINRIIEAVKNEKILKELDISYGIASKGYLNKDENINKIYYESIDKTYEQKLLE